MKPVTLLFVCCLTFLISSCGPTISSKNEKDFKISKAKMEEKLSKVEKENLEKALRVILIKAMKEKWNSPEKYNGKSFDDISLNMIDGKTYSGIISYAEDFLAANNKEEITKKNVEIDSLEKRKEEVSKTIKQIEAFKLTKISISQDDFFDEKQPFLDLAFTNTSTENLLGEYLIKIEISSKKTGKIISSNLNGGTWNDDYVLKPNEVYEYHQPLPSETIAHSNLWKTAKYPIVDFSPYDLVIKARAAKITTNKSGIIEWPKVDVDSLNAEIKKLKEDIESLKKQKNTLDELKLT